MAGIAIVVASLGLGCVSGYDAEYILFRMPYNSVNNEPVVDLKQDFTVSIIAKNNTLLTYTTEEVAKARYYWTVTDDSNKAVQFYGQGSNEITITDTEIKIGKIKVSCKVERGAISHTDDKQFEVDEHAKARLVLQTDASKTRASWLANVRSATKDEAKKAYIDKMKLGNEAESKYLRLITELDGHFEDTKKYDKIFEQKIEITNFLMNEPIIDESYNKMYPGDSLVYSSLSILENNFHYGITEIAKAKRNLANYIQKEEARIRKIPKNDTMYIISKSLDLYWSTKSADMFIRLLDYKYSHALTTGNCVRFLIGLDEFKKDVIYCPGEKNSLDKINELIAQNHQVAIEVKDPKKLNVKVEL
jgi:hypothetical protein